MVRGRRSRSLAALPVPDEVRLEATPGEVPLYCFGREAERAADAQAGQLAPLAQPVDLRRAHPESVSDPTHRHQPLMRTRVRRKFPHHGRTKRRLNRSAFCYTVRTPSLQLSRVFHRLRLAASRGQAVGFLWRPFGTRGSQVQILSPRPIISSWIRTRISHIGKRLHQADQQCRLRVWPGTPLLPTLQRPGICTQKSRDQAARQAQSRANADQLFGCHFQEEV